jgi:UPF0755 protein
MYRATRTLVLSITTVLALIVVIAIVVASFGYVRAMATRSSTGEPYKITATNIERALLGLYLRYKGPVASEPVDAADTTQIPFVIEPGESVMTVSQNLEDHNLVADAEVFRRTVQYSGADADIQVGTYVLSRSMTMEEIMEKLQRGLLPSETVVTVEGWRLEQIAAALEEKGITTADAFVAAATQSFAAASEFPYLAERQAGASEGLEGFLFPDTYQLVSGTAPSDVIQVMLRNFDWRLTPELRAEAEAQGMSIFEVVTLASIVEREAVVAEERPMIASVFLNRLEQGMPLQADPTVQYAIGCNAETGECWPQLLRDDLNAVQSPYNTYLVPGLPPGPICSPGIASIRAVLEPADTEYLYFLATEGGRHLFSETYEEHLQRDAEQGGQ